MNSNSDWYDDIMPDISATWKPCCGNLWEEAHRPNCPQLREENIERDCEEWGRETQTFMFEDHIDPQC